MSDQQPPTPPPTPPTPPPTPPPPYGSGGVPGYQPDPPASGQATTALVLGIVGLTVCPGAASIPAWIVGRAAIREIDASGGRLGGRSSAMAGYVLGIIGTALAALGALVFGIFLVVTLVFANHVTHCIDRVGQENPTTSGDGTLHFSNC